MSPEELAREREKFEKWIRWISLPPYEHMCDKGSGESAWPGQYKHYETQLAWESWLDRAELARAEVTELVEALRKARGSIMAGIAIGAPAYLDSLHDVDAILARYPTAPAQTKP